MDENGPDIRTREQRHRDSKRDAMYVSRRMVLESAAFAALGRMRSAIPMYVLLLFYTKRDIRKRRRPGTRDPYYPIVNNGELVFTYNEARERYGIHAQQFASALDVLLELGFLDIAYAGSGTKKDVSLYALSDRWRLYGTPDFVPAKRAERSSRIGFKKGNRLGRSCRRKKKSTVASHSCSTVASHS
jgi:hypothetical protein